VSAEVEPIGTPDPYADIFVCADGSAATLHCTALRRPVSPFHVVAVGCRLLLQNYLHFSNFVAAYSTNGELYKRMLSNHRRGNLFIAVVDRVTSGEALAAAARSLDIPALMYSGASVGRHRVQDMIERGVSLVVTPVLFNSIFPVLSGYARRAGVSLDVHLLCLAVTPYRDANMLTHYKEKQGLGCVFAYAATCASPSAYTATTNCIKPMAAFLGIHTSKVQRGLAKLRASIDSGSPVLAAAVSFGFARARSKKDEATFQAQLNATLQSVPTLSTADAKQAAVARQLEKLSNAWLLEASVLGAAKRDIVSDGKTAKVTISVDL